MLEIMRPTKCYFEEFLFTFRVHQRVALDVVSSSQTGYSHAIAYKIKGSDQQGGLMALSRNEGRCPSPPLPVTL